MTVEENWNGDINKQELCFSLYNSPNFEKASKNLIYATNELQDYNYTGIYGKFIEPKTFPKEFFNEKGEVVKG